MYIIIAHPKSEPNVPCIYLSYDHFTPPPISGDLYYCVRIHGFSKSWGEEAVRQLGGIVAGGSEQLGAEGG